MSGNLAAEGGGLMLSCVACLSCVPTMFLVTIHQHCEAVSYQLWGICANMSREYSPAHLTGVYVNKQLWACHVGSHIHAHPVTLPPPCLSQEQVCWGWVLLTLWRLTGINRSSPVHLLLIPNAPVSYEQKVVDGSRSHLFNAIHIKPWMSLELYHYRL